MSKTTTKTTTTMHDINVARQTLATLLDQDIPVVTIRETPPSAAGQEQRQYFAIPAFAAHYSQEQRGRDNAMISAAVIQGIVGDQLPVRYTTQAPLNMDTTSQAGSLAGGWVLIDAQAFCESEEAQKEMSKYGKLLLENAAQKMSLENAKKILG